MPERPHPAAPTLSDVFAARLDRRHVLGGFLAAAAAAALPRLALPAPEETEAPRPPPFAFAPVDLRVEDDHRVAAGHRAQVLVRWGDPVLGGAPAFDPKKLTAQAQARQFGTCNDFTAFLPLPRGSTNSDHGLLCVNHEFCPTALMWPTESYLGSTDPDHIRVEMAAHGHSVIEIRKDEQTRNWSVVPGSRFARRFTASTPMDLVGPARGHPRLRTSADPRGEQVLGTLANCAGGTTPWGTVLIAEENIDDYFLGACSRAGREATNHARLGLREKPIYQWCRVDPRFNFEREPREPNRFGWIVEYDPYDPQSKPVKRTALGRFKHEGAAVVRNADGRVVVYSGDDEIFEYLYRFVSKGRIDPANPAANSGPNTGLNDGLNTGLLDEGTLSVARFDAEGGCRWLPLVFGQGPLTPRNGFGDQGDVLIDTRRAGDLLGATPLDRPEAVAVDPGTGRVYVMLTKNVDRTPAQIDAANPRAFNAYGQVLELVPPFASEGRRSDAARARPVDHAAPDVRWNLMLLGGDPGDGRPSNPDNAAFDPQGRLWIATDQGSGQARRGVADGLWACPTHGKERASAQLFYACPRGAEMCGPSFTPDGRTLFVAVQHPGWGRHGPKLRSATHANPATRWPDFEGGVPPRSSVVAITRNDGGLVGG